MGLIAKRKRFKVGGLKVVIRLMTLNVGVYKRYGTVVIVRALPRKRKKPILKWRLKILISGSLTMD